MANHLFRGRPEELTDAELRQAHAQALAAYKQRAAANASACETARQAAEAAAALDANIQAATATVVAAMANVGQTGGEAALASALSALQAARSGNPTWAAQEAIQMELRDANRPGAAESELAQLKAEMRARGMAPNP